MRPLDERAPSARKILSFFYLKIEIFKITEKIKMFRDRTSQGDGWWPGVIKGNLAVTARQESCNVPK